MVRYHLFPSVLRTKSTRCAEDGIVTPTAANAWEVGVEVEVVGGGRVLKGFVKFVGFLGRISRRRGGPLRVWIHHGVPRWGEGRGQVAQREGALGSGQREHDRNAKPRQDGFMRGRKGDAQGEAREAQIGQAARSR